MLLNEVVTVEVVLTPEKKLSFETGKIARQASGSVVVTCGETMLFSSACAAQTVPEGIDFLPLRVDYQEKFFAAGKTLGGFIKREGRPSEKEILVSRFIDRSLRPMVEDGYRNEIQLLSYVWSYDGINIPDPISICSASAALALSDIPLIKPVAGVRIGLINGEFIINPTLPESKLSQLDLFLAGSNDAILMIEGYCDFLSEEEIISAIEFGHGYIKKICDAIGELASKAGKEKNRSSLRIVPDDVRSIVADFTTNRILEAAQLKSKAENEQSIRSTLNDLIEHIKELNLTADTQISEAFAKEAFKDLQSAIMRKNILEAGLRSDGRQLDEIRKITIETGIIPRAHGSCLFTRGETQTLAVCTLGGESMGQRFEDLDGEGLKKFYLQYFFPPFSVGEVGRNGPPGRREVGHGKLAEKSIINIVPPQESFPYTIRLESNITESNGSSSMASVCGGCLALMDSGVPIKKPVAGIAMGLILEKDRFVILSDISGKEDALGDMDFKVSGNLSGITAFQMDIKVEGITIEIMREALKRAKAGLTHILGKMLAVMPNYREEMSIYAPRIETMQVKPSKIATIIGPGGKQIRQIIEETGVQIDINDSGLVSIASADSKAMEKAKRIIESLIGEVEIGRIYEGKVSMIVAFGAFIEILPGRDGLCHISEFANTRIADIRDHVKEGDIIRVKVLDVNEKGQIKLSRKAVIAEECDN